MSANGGRDFSVGDRVMWREKYTPRRYGTVVARRGIDYEIVRDDGKTVVRGVGMALADDADRQDTAERLGRALYEAWEARGGGLYREMWTALGEVALTWVDRHRAAAARSAPPEAPHGG